MLSVPKMSVSVMGCCVALVVVLIVGAIHMIQMYRNKSTSVVKLEGFEQITKPTLIFFRANWCGHCTRFKPTWDQFVDSANDADLISKIDLVELDVDKPEADAMKTRCRVSGYPTISFLKDNDSPDEKFTGDRTVDALMSFVNSRV
jgi:thiol-disulfide isomerase/thioredoxin